jgi:hypothetical protein
MKKYGHHKIKYTLLLLRQALTKISNRIQTSLSEYNRRQRAGVKITGTFQREADMAEFAVIHSVRVSEGLISTLEKGERMAHKQRH